MLLLGGGWAWLFWVCEAWASFVGANSNVPKVSSFTHSRYQFSEPSNFIFLSLKSGAMAFDMSEKFRQDFS
jgi:hypothetical protein